MNTNIEFLDENPIENVVTCLHYLMDRVLFFGDKELIEKHRRPLKRFLKENCEVKSVDFIEVPQMDLRAITRMC